MPLHSRWSIPIPIMGLPTWLFGAPDSQVSDDLAFIDDMRPSTHRLTFSEYKLWSRRVAAGLRKAGIQNGDRVLVFSGNNIFFPVLFMGVLMAGGIFTGANPSFVARELAFQISDSDARFLFAADASLEVALEAARQASMPTNNIFIFDDNTMEIGSGGKSRLSVCNWKTLIVSIPEGENFRWFEPEKPKETTCCLNYSSGTTGIPKGVEITHYNYVANNSQVVYNAKLHPEEPEITAKSRWLCFLPMYHVMGQTNFITVAPKRGIPVYIMSKFDFIQVLKNIEKFKITQLDLVPPIVVQFIKRPETKTFDLTSVIHVASGAAPLGAEASKEFEALWPTGQVNMKQGWGMTEATCTLMAWDPRQTSRSASVGELMANCSAKIMSSTALRDGSTPDPAIEPTEMPIGQVGEVWVRAPNIMKGYWRNLEATAEIFTPDGWMKTGDVGYFDLEGKFFIVDRKKELIKVKGHQVAPAELEGELLQHQDVADVAVVGVVVHGRERPRAYIVLKEEAKKAGKPVEAAKVHGGDLHGMMELVIQRWMRDRVAAYKQLDGGIVFVDSIPKSPSGKILRKMLRDRAKLDVGDKDPQASRL